MRILGVINPRSGQSQVGLTDYLVALGRHESEIVLRFVGRHSTMASLVADAKEFDRVVAVGGDGTAAGICYALRDTGIPVVIYPGGTANLVALNLKMPADPIRLAEVTLRGSIVSLDMGEIACAGFDRSCASEDVEVPTERIPRGFLVAAGAGFDARIMEVAQELKPTIGASAYLIGALQNLTPTVARFNLTVDGERHQTDGIAVLVVNLARIQFDLAISHESDPSDGVLEVVVLRTRNAVELLPAVWNAILERTVGSRLGSAPGMDILTARDVLIESDPPLPLQYDGEVLPVSTSMRVHVLPRAATVVVPEEYAQNR